VCRVPALLYKESPVDGLLLLQEDSARQHNKSERLVYAGWRFVMTLVVSRDSETTPSPSATDTRQLDDKMGAWSPVMVDMMDSRRDFPSDGHNITKWWGEGGESGVRGHNRVFILLNFFFLGSVKYVYFIYFIYLCFSLSL